VKAVQYTYKLEPILVSRVNIFVPEIRGKGRHRLTTRGGYAHVYTDKKTVEMETVIRKEWRKQGGAIMRDFKDPFSISIVAYRALPKSAQKRRIGAPFIDKPDIDNIQKIVLDALNGIAYYDDSQCVKAKVEKAPYIPYGETSLYEVKIVYYRVDKEAE
jgi:Holliday junction resolvase RusA-like endonuclease